MPSERLQTAFFTQFPPFPPIPPTPSMLSILPNPTENRNRRITPIPQKTFDAVKLVGLVG
ncbi:TPA: hypothetical protein ACFM5B_001632 [Neisseria meningitidis]